MSIVPPASHSDSSINGPLLQASQFLLGRINYERTARIPYSKRHMKLDRMRELLTRLGNPDAGMPIVHVAGTKGKGSTSALVAGVLHAAGYDTGLFTSPHLESIAERFVVNGQACPPDELVALVDRLRPVVELMDAEAAKQGELGPTYFELATAIALMHFSQRQVDIAVLEVGLGGRLDSTNVCQPAVSVISSISLDHTRQLGTTVEQIAAEKAGIIKPGVPLLCGPLEPGPRQVISEIAQRHGCRLIESGRDFSYAYDPPKNLDCRHSVGRLDFEGDLGSEEARLKRIPLRLLGGHQAANAALAIATCVRLRKQGWLISSDSIRHCFARLTLPGRVELVHRQPTVLLDVAHNVAATEALIDVVSTSFASQEKILVLAATREKDIQGMARVLLPHFHRVLVTEYRDNPRAVATNKLADVLGRQAGELGLDVSIEATLSPTEAWHTAWQQAQPADLICVTGSFFIVAELRGAVLADVSQSPSAPASTGEPQTQPGNS